MRKATFDKYKRMVDHYLINDVKSDAYKLFHPKVSTKTASTNFEKILNITEVKKYLEDCQKALSDTANIEKEDTIKMLVTALNIDPIQYMEMQSMQSTTSYAGGAKTETIEFEGWGIKKLEDIPSDIRKWIDSYKFSPGKGITEVKLVSKTKIIEILAKMLGWNEAEKIQHQGSIKYELVPASEYIKRNQANAEDSSNTG